MKAFAIHTIMHPKLIGVGKQAPAGSVFETDEDEFGRLEPMGAVRTPTEEEIAVAETKGTLISVPDVGSAPAASGSAKPPESGEDNDPNSRPKGATKSSKAAGKPKDEDI